MTPAWPLAANGGILPTLQPIGAFTRTPRPAPGTIHRTCMYTNRNERKPGRAAPLCNDCMCKLLQTGQDPLRTAAPGP